MKILCRLSVLAVAMMLLTACGGGDNNNDNVRTTYVAEILSDQTADGDIAFDPFEQSFTMTNGPDTLFLGIDDLDPNFPEYRAFLDFPLDGSTGEDVVPGNAVIVSATLEVYINEVSFAAVVPVLIDLVSYPVIGLRAQDFDSTPIVYRAVDFFASDLGKFVSIDVTNLMQEAQRLGMSDFQVRMLLDYTLTDVGFMGIEDLPNIAVTAPMLTVEYQ